MKKYFLLSIILLIPVFICASNDFSQEKGNLFIDNYSASEYGGHIQNWAIAQDNRGVIYVANKAVVLEYDGVEWRSIKTAKSASVIRSLAFDPIENRIYAGSVGEFGYLAPDENGEMQYQSLKPLLDSAYHEFADIWKSYYLDGKIYFCSLQNIIKYCTKEEKIDTVYTPPSGSFHLSYKINNKLYVRIDEIGLTVLENDTFSLIPGGEKYNTEGVFSVIPIDSVRFYAVDRQNGIHLFNGKAFIKPSGFEKLDSFLLKNTIYHAIKLSDGNYAFATVLGGIFITNPDGEIIRRINKDNGLQDNTVLYLYEDRNNNIWTALYRGISLIEYNTPWDFWNDNNGLEGVVEGVTRYNDRIYAATSLGVSFLEDNNFKKVEGIDSQSWAISIINNPFIPSQNRLLVANYNGLFQIVNKKARKIRHFVHCYSILQSKSNPELIYIGTQSGIEIFRFLREGISWQGKINGFNKPAKFITENPNGEIWVGTITDGLYKISINREDVNNSSIFEAWINNPIIKNYDTNKGLPTNEEVRPYLLQNKLVATTNEGLFLFDKSEDKFIPDTILRPYFEEGDDYIGRLFEDHNGNCWVNTVEGKYFKKENGEYIMVRAPFQRLPNMSMFSFLPEKNGYTWIGGTLGLYRFNTNHSRDFNTPYYAIIRSATIDNDSVVYSGAKKEPFKPCETKNKQQIADFEVPYKYNSFLFTYAATFFEKEQNLLYSYKLEGFDKDWSAWSKETWKEYTNIGSGKYIFRIRAKNIYDQISEEDCFIFIVNPPWYLTSWAILAYIILSILFVYVLVKLNSRRLELKNRILQKLINERTAEIKQANEKLEKLSIVAKETENAITIFNNLGQIEWANDSFCKLYGYSIEEYKEAFGDNIYSASYNKDIRTLIKLGISNKNSIIYDYPAKNKYGKNLWIQTTLTPIYKNDVLDKLVAIDTDITKLKEIENNLKEKTLEFKDVYDMLLQQKEDLQATQDMMQETNEMLEREKMKADKLLLNVLPEEIAEELKSKGKAQPRHYEVATILFTDFVNFSKTAELKTPNELIEDLDLCFAAFDDILEKYNLEKIKTIGDSYMCAGGLPKPNLSNPIEMVLAGLEMNHFIKTQKKIKEEMGESFFDMRIGAHTGDLIAGVVGKKKFAYDVWGKTVNLASRMESSGKEGCVNISHDTYTLVKDYFECTSRGKVGVKHSGLVEMYIVTKLKPEYSEDDSDYSPNIRLLKIIERLRGE